MNVDRITSFIIFNSFCIINSYLFFILKLMRGANVQVNRISTKLTSYFFIAVLVMEISLILYLHHNVVYARIVDEFSRYMATGSIHRDVLIEYYSDTTIKHIV